ncbi:MAG: hypothetical protein QW478_12230, partial [Candidatus Micrarchaeaceae archaeon]
MYRQQGLILYKPPIWEALKKDILVSSVANCSEAPISFVTDWENAITIIEYHPNMSVQDCVNFLNATIQQDNLASIVQS